MPTTSVAVFCLLPTLALALSGCAHFSTTQTDQRNGDSTTITTRATATTLFSARSALQNWQATQTDRTQGATVGSLSQSGGTNTAATLQALTDLLRALTPAR